MLQSSFAFVFSDPLYGVLPGLCVTLVAFAYTWIADGLDVPADPDDPQWAHLLVEAALAGSGRLLVVDGVAGVGKTRLLEDASRAAGAAGMDVVSARGVALEDQFAFGIVRQLFEGSLAERASDA